MPLPTVDPASALKAWTLSAKLTLEHALPALAELLPGIRVISDITADHTALSGQGSRFSE